MIAHRFAVLLSIAIAASHGGTTPGPNDGDYHLCVTSSAVPARPPFSARLIVHALWARLDAAQRDELIAALEESVSRREARLNPLVGDLEDDPPDGRLGRLTRAAPRVFGAVKALSRARFCGADGFCVRPTVGTCMPGEREPYGREHARARFLAWPYGYGRRVRALDANASWDGAALLVESCDALDARESEVLRLYRRRAVLVALEKDDERVPADELTGGGTGSADSGSADPQPGEVVLVPGLDDVASAVAAER